MTVVFRFLCVGGFTATNTTNAVDLDTAKTQMINVLKSKGPILCDEDKIALPDHIVMVQVESTTP